MFHLAFPHGGVCPTLKVNLQAEAIVSHHEIIWEIVKRLQSTENKVKRLNQTLEKLIQRALLKEESQGRAFLSYVISHINIYLLLKIRLSLWDNLFQSDNKTESERRLLRLLNPVARARMIQALQQTDDIGYDTRKLRMVMSLVKTVDVKDLMALKNLIDGGGESHNLYAILTLINAILSLIHAKSTLIHAIFNADSRHFNADSRQINADSRHFNADLRHFNAD